ncbi:MAG: peptide ABC transporter substrate-binding protein, partial [Chloroflexota bacterium]
MEARNVWLRAVAVGFTAALTLAACAPSAPAATSPTAAPTAAPTVAPQRGTGGELKILYWQAVTVLNTHHAQGTKDYDGGRLVLEPMGAMGPNGQPVAVLAKEVPTVA